MHVCARVSVEAGLGLGPIDSISARSVISAFGLDIASIFRGPEPMLDRACHRASASVSIGSTTSCLGLDPSPPPTSAIGARPGITDGIGPPDPNPRN